MYPLKHVLAIVTVPEIKHVILKDVPVDKVLLRVIIPARIDVTVRTYPDDVVEQVTLHLRTWV
jgi:hypothetical protein